MKKIKNKTHSNKDRIICIDEQNKLFFYYQVRGVGGLKYLFEMKSSPSVFQYFHSKGHSTADNEAYLTIGELYNFHDYHNVKLAHTLERIPGWIDYVLTYEFEVEQTVKCSQYDVGTYEDERAA